MVDEPSSITIQLATVNDSDVLYNIERECFTKEAFSKQHIAYLLENPNAISLVARVNNEITGFIIGVIQRREKTMTGHIYTIDVAVKHRRRSIGSRLLNELERKFEKEGVKICYLEARVDNVAARELYHKHGYVEVGKLRDYYSGAHGVQFKKELRI